jgi:hypothetical protein
MESPEEMGKNLGSVFTQSFHWGGAMSGGIVLDVDVEHSLENAGVTSAVYSASDAITITAPPGLKSLLGKYNDDPSGKEFSDFLEQYRREIDAINE